MSQDQQTYARATQAALIGLLVQILLAIGVALVGLWTDSPALKATTWHVFGGLPIWIVLVMLYHQHRLERVETLEAEQLSRVDAQAGAIFDEHADDLDLARRRLRQLYKWGLNGVSVAVACYLITVGLVLFYIFSYEKTEPISKDADRLILLSLTIVVAFLCFIVARYIAGMTQVPEWQLLRGGASYLMGILVMAVLLAIASGFAYAGNVALFAVLALVVPLMMSLIGLEMLLTFFLGAYRPKRPGEVPRPAFDSRVLGWFTSPESIAKIISETINYQFGFEITRSWFYQLLARAITPLLVLALALLLLLSSLVIVRPHEQAIITRFGKIVKLDAEPGLHLKLPWPISKATRYPVGRIQQVRVGSLESKHKSGTPVLWTNVHTEEEDEAYLITAPTPLMNSSSASDERADGRGTAVGASLVASEVIVQYKISNLDRYVKSAIDPKLLLESIADRCVTAYFVGRDIDWLLAKGRIISGDEIRAQIQKNVDEVELGIELVNVGVSEIHPPAEQEVARAFHEQIGARQEREAEIEKANQDATETLAAVAGSQDKALGLYTAINRLEQHKRELAELEAAEIKVELIREMHGAVLDDEAKVRELLLKARGAVAKTIYEAQAYRWKRSISERADAERFGSALLAHDNAPEFYRAQRELDSLAEALQGARKYILGVSSDLPPTIRIDLKDPSSTFEGFLDQEGK